MRTPFLLLLMLLALSFAPAFAGTIELGQPAPVFTLKTLDGQSVCLADFKGKVVLLKLATTWCPTCKELSKELGAAGDFLKQKDVVVIEVFVQDSPKMIERYFEGKSYPMTHKVLLDDDQQAYEAYGVYLIPRLLVLDRELKVRYDNGATAAVPSAEELRKLVEAAAQP